MTDQDRLGSVDFESTAWSAQGFGDARIQALGEAVRRDFALADQAERAFPDLRPDELHAQSECSGHALDRTKHVAELECAEATVTGHVSDVFEGDQVWLGRAPQDAERHGIDDGFAALVGKGKINNGAGAACRVVQGYGTTLSGVYA